MRLSAHRRDHGIDDLTGALRSNDLDGVSGTGDGPVDHELAEFAEVSEWKCV